MLCSAEDRAQFRKFYLKKRVDILDIVPRRAMTITRNLGNKD